MPRFKQKNIRKQTIVITGATSGVGLATAKLAAKHRARLLLSSRNERALRDLCEQIQNAGGTAAYAVADVADPAAVEEIAEEAIRRYGGFDTWVNDAGITIFGKLMDVSLQDERRLFDVNYWGVVHGCRAAIPHLASNGGTLINIGSVLSERSLAPQGTYSASKHAVKAYTEALRVELEREKAPVIVTLIEPSSLDTPMTRHARNYMTEKAKFPPPYYAPEIVARAILHCAQHSHRNVVVGGGGAALAWSEKLAPRLVDLAIRKFAFPLQREKGVPAPLKDSLYEPPAEEMETRGDYSGHVAKTSAYSFARLHAGGLAATAFAIGAAAGGILFLRRSSRDFPPRAAARKTPPPAKPFSAPASIRPDREWRRRKPLHSPAE